MTTTFQERLQNLHVDEGLLTLIASQVPRESKPVPSDPDEIGLQLLRFLEAKPDCALEAAKAVHLPREVREIIAHKLAQEFLGKASMLPSPTSTPVEEPRSPGPETAEAPGPERSRSPYRVVFGCGYERSSSSPTDESKQKGGE